MKRDDFVYIVETNKSFDEAATAVLQAIEEKKWAVFQIYDIKERLATKGIAIEPLKIIEFCSAKHASVLLSKNRFASVCMPCKINISEENGKVSILGVKPKIIARMFSGITENELEEVDKEIKEIINSAIV